MTWKEFVRQWRPVNLTKLEIKPSTVFAWRDGSKAPKGWQRNAAELYITTKAGEKEKPPEEPTK